MLGSPSKIGGTGLVDRVPVLIFISFSLINWEHPIFIIKVLYLAYIESPGLIQNL